MVQVRWAWDPLASRETATLTSAAETNGWDFPHDLIKFKQKKLLLCMYTTAHQVDGNKTDTNSAPLCYWHESLTQQEHCP